MYRCYSRHKKDSNCGSPPHPGCAGVDEGALVDEVILVYPGTLVYPGAGVDEDAENFSGC